MYVNTIRGSMRRITPSKDDLKSISQCLQSACSALCLWLYWYRAQVYFIFKKTCCMINCINKHACSFSCDIKIRKKFKNIRSRPSETQLF
eukprot:Gb_04346 [translate_table: standard]